MARKPSSGEWHRCHRMPVLPHHTATGKEISSLTPVSVCLPGLHDKALVTFSPDLLDAPKIHRMQSKLAKLQQCDSGGGKEKHDGSHLSSTELLSRALPTGGTH